MLKNNKEFTLQTLDVIERIKRVKQEIHYWSTALESM